MHCALHLGGAALRCKSWVLAQAPREIAAVLVPGVGLLLLQRTRCSGLFGQDAGCALSSVSSGAASALAALRAQCSYAVSMM